MTNDIDARRHVVLEGTPNFRDFGGYPTRDGRQVRWRQLYRSGSLSRLSETDLVALAELGITAICDFRHDDERAREPSRWPQAPDPQRFHLPLEEGDHAITLRQLLDQPDAVRVEQIVTLMTNINRDFVLLHSGTYARLLRHVLETPGPVLIHCSAGKDRTGFGAAVILSALGVEQTQIMQDYLLTEHFLADQLDALIARFGVRVPRDVGAAIFGVLPGYLQGAFTAIESEYGDMDVYLREALGLDAVAQAELRGRLLV